LVSPGTLQGLQLRLWLPLLFYYLAVAIAVLAVAVLAVAVLAVSTVAVLAVAVTLAVAVSTLAVLAVAVTVAVSADVLSFVPPFFLSERFVAFPFLS